MLLVISALWRQRQFARRVNRLATPADDLPDAWLEECRRAVGLRRKIAAYRMPGLESPAVFGLFRPRVLIPSHLGDLSREEWHHIFLHEFTHIRNGDVLVNWLIIAARALHWFNPLAWLALWRLQENREIIRDSQSLRCLKTEADRLSYGRTLLKLATLRGPTPMPPGLAALFPARSNLHHRINMIAHPDSSHRQWASLCLAVASSLAILTATFTSAADQGQPTAQPSSEEPKAAQSQPPSTSEPAASVEGSVYQEVIQASPEQSGSEDVAAASQYSKQSALADLEGRLKELEDEIASLASKATGDPLAPATESAQVALRAAKEVRDQIIREIYRVKYDVPRAEVGRSDEVAALAAKASAIAPDNQVLREFLPKYHTTQLELEDRHSKGCGPKHPQVVALMSQLDQLSALIRRTAEAVIARSQALTTVTKESEERAVKVASIRMMQTKLKAEQAEVKIRLENADPQFDAKRHHELVEQLIKVQRELILLEGELELLQGGSSLPQTSPAEPRSNAPAPKPAMEAPSTGPAQRSAKASDFPYGIKVTGKQGMVYSPYSKVGWVDVGEMPTGIKVKCPYTGQVFRVP